MLTQKSLAEQVGLHPEWTLDFENLSLLLGIMESRFRVVEDKGAAFDQVRQEILAVLLGRIDETLTPAIETIQKIIEQGFLLAYSSTEAEIEDGNVITFVIDDFDERSVFTPSPRVSLTRTANSADYAIAVVESWDQEHGELVVTVEEMWGDPGPHDDWIISALPGDTLAAIQRAADAEAARDEAEGHANAASASAGAASGSAGSASASAAGATAAALAASKWAAEDENVVVSGGLYSARHYALKALASAVAAAAFDPSAYYTKTASDLRYYTKTDADTLLSAKADASTTTSALAGKAATSDVTAARAEAARGELRLAMMIADLKNTLAGLANGVADTFDDTTGVDGPGSTGEAAQSGYYTTAFIWVTEAIQSLPNMTANNAPATHVVSGDTETGGAAFQAFKGDGATTYWSPNGKTLPKWIQRQSPAQIRVATYKVQATAVTNGMPTAWTFEGSNNGSSWTTLDTQSGLSWSASEEKTFSVPGGSRGLYTYHRINITTAGAGASIILGEIKLLQDIQTPDAVDLRSVAFTALSAPATASLAIAAKAVGGTITVNTHLKGHVSRNNGTNWTQVTLVAKETLTDGTTIYEAMDVDISAQPSGTQMKWRVETGSAFEVQVHAVALYWR